MQTTDTNITPYNDDYNEEDNYHRILFRPDMAVQARELTQLQTILQNQIERFGDAIFASGTIIKGCSFNYDNSHHYVKLRDTRVDLQKNDVSLLLGLTVKDEATGLEAIVVNYEDGYETQNPDTKTIFVKYMNTGSGQKKTFAADDTLTFYSNGDLQDELSVKVLPAVLDAANTNPIGTGYAFSVSDGIIFQNGFFVRVSDGVSATITKYNNEPDDLVVGFTTEESIVTEFVDTNLNDNSKGFTNEKAPGAHRLKLTPTLKVYSTNAVPNSNFLVLAEWQNSQVVRENRNAVYSTIGQEFARRTAEESGDYVVTPFVITTSQIASNTTYLNLDTTQGIAYVNGYRVEKLNNLSTPLRKATDTKILRSQDIVANYGNYVFVKELSGYFEPNKVSTVNLQDTAGIQISNGSFGIGAAGSTIGTARILSIKYYSGVPGKNDTQYKVYLTDVRMNAGKDFRNVRSIQTTTGTADLILESNNAALKESNFGVLVWPFGQGAIKTLRNGANNDSSFVFRTTNTSQKFQNTGITAAITLAGGQQFPYGTGTLTETQEAKIVVIATNSANVTLTKAGNVAIANSNTSIVTGSGTSFVTEYEVGDFIAIASQGTQFRQITGIANNTSLTVQPNFTAGTNASSTHTKVYPNNTPIPIVGRRSSIACSNSTSMVITLAAANGSTETLSSNLNIAITYDVKQTAALQRTKTVQENVYVKIDCSNNAGNTVGPWSLGLPDVFKIKAVYVSNSYTESAELNKSNQFVLDDGQRDGYYGIASIKRIPGTTLALANTDKLLVVCDVFKSSGGTGGFYTIDSYPVDDANTANTTAVTTAEIPYYFSDLTGGKYNLRDCIDMRPVSTNNAVYSANAASASINPSNTATIQSASENFVAAPDETFNTSLEYYLPRVDKFVVDTNGNFQIFEGAPSDTPRPPVDVNGAMTLSLVYVKPYPSLSQKEAAQYNREAMKVTTKDQQVRRYTMKDLRNVARRVENLEYYSSLTLLEKKTTELTVKDGAGLERFKNGIFVDGFDNVNIANLADFEFNVIMDTKNSVIRPAINQQPLELKYSNGDNVHNGGEVVSLDYIDKSLIDQGKASRTRSLGGVSWEQSPPTPEVWPPYDPVYDHVTPPVRTYNGPYYSTHWNAEGYVDYYTNEDNTQKFTVAEIARRTGFGSDVKSFLIGEGFAEPHPELHHDYPLIDAMPFTA